MTRNPKIHLPVACLRFIGVTELLGGLGLVLPGAFRIRLELRPLAAFGLVIIMTGATAITVAGSGVLLAVFPFVVGVLAAAVCFGRGGLGFVLSEFRRTRLATV